MEKQSPTPQKSNDKFFSQIKDNLNYIYIGLMIIVNIVLNILVIEDGYVGVSYPSTTLGWVMWAVRLVLQTTVGCLILNSFRRQGIKLGHKNEKVNEVYQRYLEVMRTLKKDNHPRSLKQYLGTHGAKDTASKSVMYIITTILVGSLMIGANWNSILSLAVNIILAIAFGIKALMEAENYVITELILWYQLKIAEVTDQKLEPAKEKENGNNQLQGHASEPGHAEPSGVQPQEECATGPTDCDTLQPSERDTNSET